jgi:hypothetical protein
MLIRDNFCEYVSTLWMRVTEICDCQYITCGLLWHRKQGDIYELFEGTFCLFLYSEERGGMFWHKFGDHIPDYFKLEDENW